MNNLAETERIDNIINHLYGRRLKKKQKTLNDVQPVVRVIKTTTMEEGLRGRSPINEQNCLRAWKPRKYYMYIGQYVHVQRICGFGNSPSNFFFAIEHTFGVSLYRVYDMVYTNHAMAFDRASPNQWNIPDSPVVVSALQVEIGTRTN